MARFLFTTWEGGGHVQPMLLVARDLAARGHAVLVLSDPCNAPDAAALDVPFGAWTTAPFQTGKTRDDDRLKDHEADNPLAVIQRLLDRVMAGPALAYANDTLAAIDAFAPDVVVSQELLLGPMAAAEARRPAPGPAGRQCLVAADDAGRAAVRGGDASGRQRRRAGHARHGRPDEPDLLPGRPTRPERRPGRPGPAAPGRPVRRNWTSPRRSFWPPARHFDFAPEPLPAPSPMSAPYLADPAWVEPFTPPPGDAPLVMVSFSSLYQAQEPVLRAIIAALGRLPVRGVVTTGPTIDPAEFDGAGQCRCRPPARRTASC